QKVIHLRAGNVSANVVPQPKGRPMLVHTASAVMEVLGTQFKVETDLAATSLNVNEGTVRLKRLSDGTTLEVPANHRVIAAADREMSLMLVPRSVTHWKTQLHLGPERARGRWLPKSEDSEAKLLAVPLTMTTRQGKTITLYNTSFQVSSGDGPPVILEENSELRVRGRLTSPQRIHVGVTVRTASGDFAGNFETYIPASEFTAETPFTLNLNPRDFQLDPTLAEIRGQLPSGPEGLVVASVWVHSLFEPAGLEISEIELIPPAMKPHSN
ncbi:MAG: FecR domain-containing protein, partial [Rubripirellula sp.]